MKFDRLQTQSELGLVRETFCMCGFSMNTHAILRLVRQQAQYKNHFTEILQLVRSAVVNGQCQESEFERRLRESFPWVWKDLNSTKRLALEKDWARQELLGHRLVCYGESLYPASFYFIDNPPLFFTYWGEPCWISQNLVSVVGSREPCDESLLWMEKELSAFCRGQFFCVVSGGARGVDQRAHSLALRSRRPTVVVLPSGIEQLYPESLRSWVEPVLAQGGCFISEYESQQRMQKFLFPHRNRLIAALGSFLVVIEARRKSGTLSTVQQAIDCHKPVLVVPGHPLDERFAGSLDLLADGAFLVRDAQDLDTFFEAELWSMKNKTASIVEKSMHLTMGSGDVKREKDERKK